MKIEWEINKKIWTASGIVLAVLLALGINAKANIFAIFAGAAAFFLICSVKLTLPEKLEKWKDWKLLWAVLILFLSAFFTERQVQYLLVEPGNRGKLSDTNAWLNVFCCLVIILVVFVITASVRVSAIIGHLALMILAFINYFVYQFRGNEFSFGDVKAAATGLSVASKYEFKLQPRALYVIILMVLFINLVRRCKLEFKKKWIFRLGAAALVVALFSYISVKTENTVMESWEQKGTYRNGYILNFALSIRDSFVSKPEGYSEEAIEALEDTYGPTTQEGSDDDPTIIVVMNESFADLSKVGNIQTTEPVTPFLDSISENAIKGYALSSVYGAKTPNSEWEFLTGNSMAFLPSGSVAYQQYMSEEPYTLVSTLKERGYTCLAMHPYFSTGWSRNKIYPMMGFDEMHFVDDFDRSKIMREYVTDEELYNGIIKKFEAKEEGEKLFVMSITMQNHGGYTDTYRNFTNHVQMTNGYYSDVNQYLTLVNESDKALEKLITYFENVDDKVEIVFFGDHQPGLNSDFYRQLNGKGLAGLTLQELQDLFTVPFFIWTNYESQEKEVEITSLNYLSTMALEQAGIELPTYNRFLKDMMEVVPAMNSRAYYSSAQGGYRHYENAVGAPEESWLEKYELLQYNNLFDDEKSKVFFPFYGGETED